MPVDQRIEFRVGVHEGNIVVEDQHIFGVIQHTVRYTELSPDRFKDFWRGIQRN